MFVSHTCRQTTYLQASVTEEMLLACGDVKLIELSEERVTGVPVMSVMNLRIITDTEFLLFVGEFCLCVCVCVQYSTLFYRLQNC